MDCVVIVFSGSRLQLLGVDHSPKLPMRLLPLIHQWEGKEVLLAREFQFAAGEVFFELMKEIPNVEQRKKVGFFIGELFMRSIGGPLSFDRSHSRILNFQRRGDNQNLRQTVLIIGCENHASNSGVYRKPSQSPAHWSQPPVIVDRAKLKQRFESVPNRFRSGRIKERELVDLAELERQCLENDRSQIGPANLRDGELGSRFEILLRI